MTDEGVELLKSAGIDEGENPVHGAKLASGSLLLSGGGVLGFDLALKIGEAGGFVAVNGWLAQRPSPPAPTPGARERGFFFTRRTTVSTADCLGRSVIR